MRACIQRVRRASVTIADEVVGRIGQGLVVLVGVAPTDGLEEIRWLADKLVGMRIFNDDAGKMNRSLAEVAGEMLVVSQFTLFGDARRGRRPGFTGAAPPEIAEQLYLRLVEEIRTLGVRVETGRFRAHMIVAIENDGPVTLWLDTADR